MYALSQQAVTCSLAKGSGQGRHSCEVQVVRVAMAGHVNLSHPYCTKPHHTKPLFPPFADNLHSHHLLGQPCSDEHLLLSCSSVCCPCAYHWASQEILGKHLGAFRWQWCLSGGLFLFPRPYRVILRNWTFFFLFSLTLEKVR